MSHDREILVVVFNFEPRNDAVRTFFQLRREVRVMLWSDDLHWDSDCVDLLFREKSRMRSGDAANEIVALPNVSSELGACSETFTSRSKLGNSPSTITEADGPPQDRANR